MEFIEILKIVFLGIIEGITEWLPISSTGHMILADEFIKLQVSDEFMEMFRVVIQLGAIMAVVGIYFKKLNPFFKPVEERNETISLWLKVIAACLPAAVIGFLFDDWLNEKLYNYITVAIMLILYGVLFIIVENTNRGKQPRVDSLKNLSYTMAILIGGFQVLALIPGTSRSGATILGAIILGASRVVAAEFTFFLAIPIMVGASGYKLVKYGLDFSGTEIAALLLGVFVAFVVSVAAIKFLMGYIKRNDFKVFGVYRIVLGIVVVAYFVISSNL